MSTHVYTWEDAAPEGSWGGGWLTDCDVAEQAAFWADLQQQVGTSFQCRSWQICKNSQRQCKCMKARRGKEDPYQTAEMTERRRFCLLHVFMWGFLQGSDVSLRFQRTLLVLMSAVTDTHDSPLLFISELYTLCQRVLFLFFTEKTRLVFLLLQFQIQNLLHDTEFLLLLLLLLFPLQNYSCDFRKWSECSSQCCC